MKRLVVAAASALALVLAGSAAGGLPDSGPPAPGAADAVSVVEDGLSAVPPNEITDRGGDAMGRAGLIKGRKGARTRLPEGPEEASSFSAPQATGSEVGATVGEPAPDETAASPREAAQAQGPPGIFPGLAATGHAGYATGSVIHADAIENAATRLVNADVAFSGASFSSGDLTGAVTNEMSRVVAPALAAGNAFGRGSGLEAGVVNGESAPNQVVLPDLVEAKAPPSTALVSRDLVDQAIDPVLAATVLRAQAQSLGGAACTTGVDLSFGLGHVGNLALVETAADQPLLRTEVPEGATEAVSQSRSATRLVAQSGTQGIIQKLGLQSEVRQTIAPVTFFGGTDNQFTIQLLGEWVLRATADGREGSIFYGPGTVEPTTPVLQVLDAAGEVTDQVTSQDLFGEAGLVIEIPDVAQIAIGEDPRAIGGDVSSKAVETATAASAAVDVVRVQLLNQGGLSAAGVRIGHLEAAVAVPEGGITCGIGLTKDSVPDEVTAGQPFQWALRITNPNDCTLSKIKLVDTISVTDGVRYTVTGTTPRADSASEREVVWNDLGSLESGKSRDLLIDGRVAKDSAGGIFTDKAVVTGLCGPVPLSGTGETTTGAGTGVSIPLQAEAALDLPRVTAVLAAVRAPAQRPAQLPVLPRTGRDLLSELGLAMVGMGGGVFLRATNRRRGRGGDV